MDNRTIEEIRENETKLINELKEEEKEIDRLNNIIKELSKDVDMWNRKYNEQFDIINGLEKWIKENNLGKYRTENVVDTDELLDKLKELKENK